MHWFIEFGAGIYACIFWYRNTHFYKNCAHSAGVMKVNPTGICCVEIKLNLNFDLILTLSLTLYYHAASHA